MNRLSSSSSRTISSFSLSATLAISALVGGASVSGCSSEPTAGCPAGTLNCPCDTVGMCVTGLMCETGTNTCIQGLGSGGATGTGGASATGGTGGTGTGGVGATGSTAGTGGVVSTGGVLSTGGASGGAGTGGSGATGATGGASGGATGGVGASGGLSGDGGAGTGGDGTGGTTPGAFTLTSAELTDGGMFAAANTCTSNTGNMKFGDAISLEWSGAPEGTQSFALTMIDVSLVDGAAMDYLGCHSAFWNVPASETSMPAGSWDAALAGAQNIRKGYLGPCPPNGPDTYVLTLYALPDATFAGGDFNSLASCNTLRDALDAAALEKVTLSGTYIQP